MNITRHISDLWFYLTHPGMWTSRLGPYNAEWDAWLTKAVDEEVIVELAGHCTAKIRGVKVWAGNWPYAFGSPYLDGDDCENIYPSRRTARRLKNEIDALKKPRKTAAQVIEMALKEAAK